MDYATRYRMAQTHVHPPLVVCLTISARYTAKAAAKLMSTATTADAANPIALVVRRCVYTCQL